MSWKNVKEHYRIVHQVQVTEAGICIGSPYIHDIIVISRDGVIVKEDDRTLNAELMRYQQEMKADLGKLKELVSSPDTFGASVPVYTYDGASIIEKQCEEPGWPNVTHDGLMMYENTFSTDRTQVVEWAKRNCLAWIKSTRRDIAEQEERLAFLQSRLNQAEADATALGITPPAPVQISVGSEPVAWTTKGNLETLASTPKEARYMWGLPSGSTISVPLYASPQAPAEHVMSGDLPADIIESLLTIGPVEWGVSLTQPDEKHATDLLDTLRITREHFGVTDQETGIHGVYLEGTGTVLAHTGMSPNSPQHARILVGAWNQLVELAKAQVANRKVERHG